MHPVNTVTNGLKKFDRIIKRVTILTRVFFFTRKCMAVCRAATKSGRKAGFHCIVSIHVKGAPFVSSLRYKKGVSG